MERIVFRVEVCAEPSFSDPTRMGKVTRHTVVTSMCECNGWLRQIERHNHPARDTALPVEEAAISGHWKGSRARHTTVMESAQQVELGRCYTVLGVLTCRSGHSPRFHLRLPAIIAW